MFGNQAKKLLQEAKQSFDDGRFQEAQELFASARQCTEGTNQPLLLQSLQGLFASYEQLNQWNEAYESALQVVSLSEKLSDNESWSFYLGNAASYGLKLQRYDDALALVLRAIELDQSTGNVEYEAWDHRTCADIYIAMQRWQDALSELSEAASCYERLGNQEALFDCYWCQATSYNDGGDYTKAISSLDSTIQLATQMEDELWIAQGHKVAGDIHYHHDNYRAEASYLLALPYFEREKHVTAILVSRKLARIHMTRRNFDTAISYGERALELAQERYKKNVSICMTNLGNTYFEMADYDEAESLFSAALALDKEAGDEWQVALKYGALGAVYTTWRRLDEARECQENALAVYQKYGKERQIANALVNLSSIEMALGNWTKCERFASRSLTHLEKLGHSIDLTWAYSNLGTANSSQRQYDAAESWHKKALENDRAMGREDGMAIQYQKLGDVYFETGLFDRSAEMYRKSKELCENLSNMVQLGECEFKLGLICEKTGDPRSAIEHLERTLQLWDNCDVKEEANVREALQRLSDEHRTT